ncbi:histidine phosphatase family protein [Streptomyces sp. NPDC050315]|uniref:histidine phosphatase family protein n=1 Tax=Streptomyces sp. NPDC050315 TaxID=3155039 RepID=UPI0034320CAB
MTVRLTLVAAGRSSSLLEARFDDDRPLDAMGWHEVERAAPALSPLAAAELRYCSPSARSRETGELLGLTPLVQPALRDCDMGRWRGRTLRDVAAAEPQAVDAWLADPRTAPHGGESLLAFIIRVGNWLDTRPVGDGGSALAVADPGVIRAALIYALKVPPHAYWRLDVLPLSVTALHGHPGSWTLVLSS